MRPLLYGFLIARREGGAEGAKKQLDEGIWAWNALLLFTYITCFAFPRVTWRKHLLVSHNLPLHPSSTALSSLDHCNFSALTPKNCCIKAGVFCQTTGREGENQQRRGTNRGAKTGLAGLCAQHQVITSLLIYCVWTYSCSSGPDSKQIAAAEGL